jgi:hypothetical protein
MTSYSIYQGFLKITISQKLGTWVFCILDGSKLLTKSLCDFETRQDCEKDARAIASFCKSLTT